ncbi:MAG: Type phosphodiesterase / nucleotide pyrophosphatase, partial [Myxococcales bacterium]|nr:Type phosphodiesterase / nucleotide pyrophosphatase [Myxococcales bacterium]
MKRCHATILGGLCLVFSACGQGRAVVGVPNGPRAPKSHVVLIDIDDHGLAGLWMAHAPNLRGLIARGTLAFSRVDTPTHSNQNNITLLTGQYPEGHDVPANNWLSRDKGFVSPVNLPGFEIGAYALYGSNPLLTRGDSLYRAVRAAGGRSAYVGELPPFEVGADDVHLSLVGTMVHSPFGT